MPMEHLSEAAGISELSEMRTDASKRGFELPDDSGIRRNTLDLPDDSGTRMGDALLPASSGKLSQAANTDCGKSFSRYCDLNDMKQQMGMTYKEIKAEKPPHSPNLSKWFDHGGLVQIEQTAEGSAWRYIDWNSQEVPYIEGYPKFPPEAKHSLIPDLSIGEFTGDRNEDKRLYLERLEEEYGLTEIPEGYVLHHDSVNGNMQLVKEDWHQEFTHSGGHSKFKEEGSC